MRVRGGSVDASWVCGCELGACAGWLECALGLGCGLLLAHGLACMRTVLLAWG